MRIFLETANFLKILNYFRLKEDAGLHSKYPNPLYLGMLSANYGGNWPCDSSKNVKKKIHDNNSTDRLDEKNLTRKDLQQLLIYM